MLDGHAKLAPRFLGLFEAEAAGKIEILVSTITIAEVLAGPFGAGQEALAQRYATALQAFGVVAVSADIAISAARLRSRYKLKLPDALQLATALEVGAYALVTHDSDFSAVEGINVLSGG